MQAAGGVLSRCFPSGSSSPGTSISTSLIVVFIGGGRDKRSITPAVTQMFVCLFSLQGVAASSYEKYGKNSETRGISAYFFASVMLPAVQLQRLRVGACRWHRLHKRERVLCRVND